VTVPIAWLLPDPKTLRCDQAVGRVCIWCGQLLTIGAVGVGVIRDRLGVHVLDVEAWVGPCCMNRREGS